MNDATRTDAPASAAPAGEKPWLAHYPEGVPATVDASRYPSLLELFEESFATHASNGFYTCMGKTLTYAEVDRLTRQMAGYYQSLGLQKGDRIAVMAPNVFQQPIAVLGALRAGYVVVNVNPLYTARELKHQMIDSGAKAIVILENFAVTLQEVIAETEVEHVVVTGIGDMLGLAKGAIVNAVVRHVKKMVPPFHLPGAISFKRALQIGRKAGYKRPAVAPDDLAILQYTGGTTGLSKGAMLLHKTLVHAMLSTDAWSQPVLAKRKSDAPVTSVCALPLYHVFALVSVHFGAILKGGRLILIPNPRDLPAFIDALKGEAFHTLPGVNTLFAGLANNPEFQKLDFSNLMISNGGGTAVLEATAKKWKGLTGCTIVEGYGLSETSSGVCCNPATATEFSGTVGLPMPGIEMRILDDNGDEAPIGERGEICIRGGSVMVGYWNKLDDNDKVFTKDGYFRSGDIGIMDERGYFSVVDRKKDMILVSGFNVYPNEIEDVVASLEGVVECAAVGVPDEQTGEAIRLYVVAQGHDAQSIKDYCRKNLVAYKCPKQIEFVDELPKSNVGKILRRELRDQALAETKQA